MEKTTASDGIHTVMLPICDQLVLAYAVRLIFPAEGNVVLTPPSAASLLPVSSIARFEEDNADAIRKCLAEVETQDEASAAMVMRARNFFDHIFYRS